MMKQVVALVVPMLQPLDFGYFVIANHIVIRQFILNLDF